jgi:hypothetical protein
MFEQAFPDAGPDPFLEIESPLLLNLGRRRLDAFDDLNYCRESGGNAV